MFLKWRTINKQEGSVTLAGEQLGIWLENWKLNELALKVAKNEINIENYFDIVLFNYLMEINGKTYNPLAIILRYCYKTKNIFLKTKNIE